MIGDFFLSTLLGALLGIGGAVPFLHTNLVLQFAQEFFSPVALAGFAVAICFSRLVFEAFSSAFLLIPSESQGASLLAGNRMTLSGRGLEALEISARSFALALAASVLLLPFFLAFSPALYSEFKPFVLFAVMLVVFAMFGIERSAQKAFLGMLAFALSGAVGVFSLGGQNGDSALFALLTGLFGFSSVLASHGGRETGRQENPASVPWHLNEALAGVGMGAFSSFLPAMSPAFLSALAFPFFERRGERAFIALNCGVVASKALFDFAAVFSIGKARSGAAAAIKPAVFSQSFGIWDVAAIAIFSFAFSLLLFHALLPRLLSAAGALARDSGAFSVLLFIALLAAVFALSGARGLLVAAIATAAGLLPFLFGVKRSYSMGALIVPAMVYLYASA